MIVTDKTLQQLAKESQLVAIYFGFSNINSVSLKCEFSKLEYLSLRNNNIKDMTFITFLPNIWYLDLRNNSVDNFKVFNQKNVFGFLGLSVDKYSESNILQIKKINVGILCLDLDENYKKFFLTNNPNIMKMNEEIIYFTEKHISPILAQTPTNNPSSHPSASLFNHFLKLPSKYDKDSFTQQNSVELSHLGNQPTAMIKRLSFRKNSLTIRIANDHNFSNDKLKSLIKFFETFNREMNDFLTRPLNLLNNIQLIQENEFYYKIEKRKLITLSKIYQSFLDIHDEKSANNIDTSSYFSPLEKDEKMIYINFHFLKLNDIFLQIVILCILILYILKILGKELTTELFKYIFKNYMHDKTSKLNEIKILLELDLDTLVGIYFDTYDNLNILIHKTNCSYEKYMEILRNLEMHKIIIKCNILKFNAANAVKIYDNKNELENRKNLINTLIVKFLDENLKIFEEMLNVVQYLFDFIMFNKIDQVFLKENAFSYRVLIEIRQCLFNYLNKKTKQNLIFNSLTDRKYEDMKYKTIGVYLNSKMENNIQEAENNGKFSIKKSNINLNF